METINNDDRLLRRVPYLDPNFIKDDGRPASSAFNVKSGEDGLSVDLERLTTYANSIRDRNKYRLYGLRAGFTISLGLQNVHEPQEDNHAHSLIKGRITKGIARKLAAEALRIDYP